MLKRALVLSVVLGIGLTGYALAQDGPKNLKVLPKSMDKKAVRELMKTWTKALGQDCEFCHDLEDFAKDDNKHKVLSRTMYTMTEELNKKHFQGKPKVTCMTCHNGKKEPAVK